jgi:hypothetical protein
MSSTLPTSTPPTPRETGRDPQLHLGSLVWGAVFMLVGIGWLLELLDIVDVRWSMLLPAVLVLVGAVLVLGARHARTGGLIALGIVLLMIALFVGMVRGIDGPTGERTEHPTSLTQLDDSYAVGVGSTTVDLSDIAPDEYDGVERIQADVGLGEMRIIVPDGVEVRLDADVAMGEARLFDESVSGFGAEHRLETDDYDDPDAEARLRVDADVAMGSLRIDRE